MSGVVKPSSPSQQHSLLATSSEDQGELVVAPIIYMESSNPSDQMALDAHCEMVQDLKYGGGLHDRPKGAMLHFPPQRSSLLASLQRDHASAQPSSHHLFSPSSVATTNANMSPPPRQSPVEVSSPETPPVSHVGRPRSQTTTEHYLHDAPQGLGHDSRVWSYSRHAGAFANSLGLTSSFDAAACSPMTTSTTATTTANMLASSPHATNIAPYLQHRQTLDEDEKQQYFLSQSGEGIEYAQLTSPSVCSAENGDGFQSSPVRGAWGTMAVKESSSPLRNGDFSPDMCATGTAAGYGCQAMQSRLAIPPPLPTTLEVLDREGPVRSYVTSEIVLRSTNGNHNLDVHYPLNPSLEMWSHALTDPHMPARTSHTSNGGGSDPTHGHHYGSGMPHSWGHYSTLQQSLPPFSSQSAHLPGSLPYTSPNTESYALSTTPSAAPRRQDEKLRFAGDLYTPRWVRGEGIGREGWCSLCENGNWLHLKTSQYLYHVRSTHGVNSNTGRIYDPPLQLRICDDTFGSTYGLCSECNDWVPIVTPRRKRSFTAWFKHAHQCHRRQHRLTASLHGGFINAGNCGNAYPLFPMMHGSSMSSSGALCSPHEYQALHSPTTNSTSSLVPMSDDLMARSTFGIAPRSSSSWLNAHTPSSVTGATGIGAYIASPSGAAQGTTASGPSGDYPNPVSLYSNMIGGHRRSTSDSILRHG